MERVYKIYTDSHGPSKTFIRSLLFLLDKHGYVFDAQDREDVIKTLIKKEFNAVFINDEDPKLVFDSEHKKTLFLMKFN
jgi:hypothetical protein